MAPLLRSVKTGRTGRRGANHNARCHARAERTLLFETAGLQKPVLRIITHRRGLAPLGSGRRLLGERHDRPQWDIRRRAAWAVPLVYNEAVVAPRCFLAGEWLRASMDPSSVAITHTALDFGGYGANDPGARLSAT
jgi:hypothetical protein